MAPSKNHSEAIRTLILVLTSLATAGLGDAQVADEPVGNPDLIITAESNLVVVPFHVYRNKSSINGLGAESFELLEDGVVQEIAFVEGPPADGGSHVRTVPTEIIFLIDFSFSVMTPGLLDFTTIRNTMLEGLREDVMISVYGFASKLKRFTGPTRDPAKLQRALDLAYASEAGGSRVYEAIMQTARDASSGGGNVSRMMIVFSDGFSTTKLKPELVVGAANAFGIPIYPVVLGHDRIVKQAQGIRTGRMNIPINPGLREPGRRGPRAAAGASDRAARSRAQERRQMTFADFGPKTGGRSYDLDVINSKVMGRKSLKSLSTLAETEYIAGYYPKAVDEELTAHRVEIRLVSQEIGRMYGGRRTVLH